MVFSGILRALEWASRGTLKLRGARSAQDQIFLDALGLVPEYLRASAFNPYQDPSAFMQPGVRENLEWVFDNFPYESLGIFSNVVQGFANLDKDLHRRYTLQEMGGNVQCSLAMNAVFVPGYELSVMSRSPVLEQYAGPALSGDAAGRTGRATDEETDASFIFTEYMVAYQEFSEAMGRSILLSAQDVDALVLHAKIGHVPMEPEAEQFFEDKIGRRPGHPDDPGARMFSTDEQEGYEFGPPSDEAIEQWIRSGATVREEWARQRREMKDYFTRLLETYPGIDLHLGVFFS
ncbi:MAG: hypothetical protein R3B98_10335 [Hyphomonas sp.]